MSYSEPRFHDGFNPPIDIQVEEPQGKVVQVISDTSPNVKIRHAPDYYENFGTQGKFIFVLDVEKTVCTNEFEILKIR